MMHCVWFWTFWHWSKESFRHGSLLRSPLHGIGSHWDEWFRHEASGSELQAIDEAGRTESNQRQFIAWLFNHWARETEFRNNRTIPRFVAGQLANVPPFRQWRALDEYRTGYGVAGITAIVLAADSAGEAEDVRPIEALVLPAGSAAKAMSEGFHADSADLDLPRRAAMSLLNGKGLFIFLAHWIVGGRRPYSRWLGIAMAVGWLAAGALFLYLLLGPEAGNHLVPASVALLTLWAGLVSVATGVVVAQSLRTWRQGQRWSAQLEESEIRLRMEGGLTIQGGSAGLPFCLNTLLALFRANPQPARRRSWIWQTFFSRARSDAGTWSATGVITADGYLKPVVLEPKLRACLLHSGVRHLITPRQRDASKRSIDRVAKSLQAIRANRPEKTEAAPLRLAFAAEKRCLSTHGVRHLAQAVMALGRFPSRWQKGLNAFALVLSGAVLFAFSDLKAILYPPPAPVAVAPSSPSPYHLWVSLDTREPERFRVVLESDYWANRRANIALHGGPNVPARGELFLQRTVGETFHKEEDGTVWVERRRRFLNREYAAGERVGRYSVTYLTHLERE